jgi:hypothetical protein
VRPQVLISVSVDREAGCVTFSSQTATLGTAHAFWCSRDAMRGAQQVASHDVLRTVASGGDKLHMVS